jgi:hypothetical protein
MTPRRATRITLCLLAVAFAVLILLTWRQVRQESLDRQLGRAFWDDDRQKIFALLAEGADPNTFVTGEDTPALSIMTLLQQRLTGSKPPSVIGIPCLLWALGQRITPEAYLARFPDDGFMPSEDPELVAALLQHGANASVQDAYGATPLWMALLWRHEREATLLVQWHADVNLADKDGNTPLTMAAKYIRIPPSNLSIVSLLVASGARANVRDADNMTPFLHMFEHGWPDLSDAECLLAHGADIDAQDNVGRTALIYTVWTHNLPAVRFLLAHHANVNLSAHDGSALKYAKGNKKHPRNEAIISLLKKAGAKE